MVICPFDNAPCEQDCPDRFRDTPDGGCTFTLAMDMGAKLLIIPGCREVGILFNPECAKEV